MIGNTFFNWAKGSNIPIPSQVTYEKKKRCPAPALYLATYGGCHVRTEINLLGPFDFQKFQWINYSNTVILLKQLFVFK